MKLSIRTTRWTSSALALAALACSSDPATGTSTKDVGPAGGTLSIAGARLIVPAGALSQTVSLTVTVGGVAPRALPSGVASISELVTLTPHGLAFAVPVTVRVPTRETPGEAPKVLRLADGASAQWSVVAGSTRDGNGMLFTTRRFSYYAVGRGEGACVPQCAGRVCGDDGCGDTCGACSSSQTCDSSGACVASTRGRCGDLTGLQANAPWPMGRGCANRSGRSAALGPDHGVVGWSFVASDGGTLGAPSVGVDGTIYVGSSTGNVYALSAATGIPRWTYAAGAAVSVAPAIASSGSLVFGDDAGTLHGVSSDGQRVFARPLGGADAGAEARALDTDVAIAADGTILVVSAGGRMHGLDSSGAPRWSKALGGAPAGGPSIGPTGTVYVALRDGNLFAHTTSGAAVFQQHDPSYAHITSGVLVGDTQMYFPVSTSSGAGQLVSLTFDRARSWRADLLAALDTAPAIAADGSLILATVSGTAAFNGVQAVSDATHAATWRSSTAQGTASTPAVDGAGVLYYGDRSGTLHAVTPDGLEKWSVVVAAGKALGSPVIGAATSLYVAIPADRALASIQQRP